MNNEQEHTPTDELLARYLAGETDSGEKEQVENWIDASKENRAHYESMKKTWDATEEKNGKTNFNTDAAWSRMKVRMNSSEETPAKQPRNFSRIAASITVFLIMAVALLWYLQPTTPMVQPLAFNSGDQFVQDTLPDGSIISLNKNSRLTYPSSFTGAVREVTLIGEAFFEVHKDAAHPFIIHTGQMDIKVLGTSFNVRAYPKSDSVRVSVKTGRVQCFAANDTVVLLPGEMVVYDEPSRKMNKRMEDDPNTLSYRNRIFKFKDTKLSDAIRLLNEVYGSNIKLKNDKLGDCGVNGDFVNEPIEKIVTIIGETLGFKVERGTDANTFFIDGQPCPN